MKKLIPVLLLFFAFNIYSQKEANFWYFGENAGLDFSTNPPTTLTDGKLNTTEGCSSFSSPSGSLLFYSDGIEVFNKNHDLMNYSDGRIANNLKGNPSSTQSGMIIPKPDSNTIYYLFTVGTDFVGNAGNPNPGFNYYTIDMSKNTGLGEITDGPVNLAINPNNNVDLSERWSEKVAAIKGEDCDTFWVLSFVENTFYAYKVSENGVEFSNAVLSTVNFNAEDKRGYLQVSPNGKKIAFADYGATSRAINGSLVLFDFNNKSGEVSANYETLISYNTQDSPYGVAFSRDSKKLYTSTYNNDFNVYQFDLDATNIASSKFNIKTKSGFRGALQLGPDGKIYASIPDRGFLDAIENPSANANEVIYTDDAINLGGNLTAQGLPPFISSLLLPIEITDTATNEVVNNQNLQFCIGQNKKIESAPIVGPSAIYEWTFDDGTTSNPIQFNKDLILTNINPSNAGMYTLAAEITDNCGNTTTFEATFTVAVFEAAIASPISFPPFCDTDNDGYNMFDLQTDVSPTILETLDPTVFQVRYFESMANATSSIDAISNPYTNPTPFSTQTIYARVENRNAQNACPAFTSFTLAVTGFPMPETPSDLPLCDNASTGSDTDGFRDDFILENKDAEVLGNNLDAAQYIVSYHTSLLGSQTSATSDVIPKATNYTNTRANTQPIYVRVENVDNAACFDASKTFNLIVNPLPDVASSVELLQCDDDLDRVSTINLTEAEISVSNNYINESFAYFETETDAILGNPQVADKLRYPVNRSGTAWVRTISDKNCYRISKINLKVEAAADVDYYKNFPSVCDDFLEKEGTNGALNDDTDGITNFDFSQANTDILEGFFPPALQPDLEITYFETKEDRIAVVNAIADIENYRNIGYPSDITKQTIYFKITNKNNNNCNGSGELYLKTNPIPTATQAKDMQLCDSANDGDATNGIVQNFDLKSQTQSILGTQSDTEYTVTYHLSKADARSGNAAETSPFQNTVRDLQTIYVRVTNNNTRCFTDRTSFDLIVNPLPIANFVPDIEICDDPSDGSARNGFSQTIDLESQTDGILGTQDPAIYKVTYHHSLGEAQDGSNALLSPYSNEIPNRETIYVRTYNSSTKCANGISNFDVIINPEPTFTTVSNLSYCDNDLDGDDTDGIIQNIDLESQIPLLLGTSQDPDDFNVSFHSLQADASSGNLPITSPYANTNVLETMYVRIQNKATSCVNDDATFDVIVNTLPGFTVTSDQILCLNDTPKNIAVENPLAIYSYVWRDVDGNTIGKEDNLNVTSGGNYTVTATTTNGTNCGRTKTITVKESNPAILLNSFVTIVDEGNTIGSENNLSIVIDVITNNLGAGDYQFALRNDDENTTTLFQDEPLFENLEGGIYTIIVNDKNGCAPDATLQISVLQFPKFFTPNGDGKNDTWVIKGANKAFYPNSSINIFNRFGKLVAQIPLDGEGWNGTYNSKILPSNDYWYTITLIPADISKTTINKTGNFSLLRK